VKKTRPKIKPDAFLYNTFSGEKVPKFLKLHNFPNFTIPQPCKVKLTPSGHPAVDFSTISLSSRLQPLAEQCCSSLLKLFQTLGISLVERLVEKFSRSKVGPLG
jgi:hypothetical protein